MQIQGKVFWCKFEKIGKNARLDNEVLADKDEIDKEEAKSYMIAGFVILTL